MGSKRQGPIPERISEDARIARDFRKQLSPQAIDELVADRGRGVNLQVGKAAVRQCDGGDRARQEDEGEGRPAVHEPFEGGQGRWQRSLQENVVEDDLQWPGRRELGERDPEEAEPGQNQAELHRGEAVEGNPPEPSGASVSTIHERFPGKNGVARAASSTMWPTSASTPGAWQR